MNMSTVDSILTTTQPEHSSLRSDITITCLVRLDIPVHHCSTTTRASVRDALPIQIPTLFLDDIVGASW